MGNKILNCCITTDDLVIIDDIIVKSINYNYIIMTNGNLNKRYPLYKIPENTEIY